MWSGLNKVLTVGLESVLPILTESRLVWVGSVRARVQQGQDTDGRVGLEREGKSLGGYGVVRMVELNRLLSIRLKSTRMERNLIKSRGVYLGPNSNITHG